jgi:hypothetical protein
MSKTTAKIIKKHAGLAGDILKSAGISIGPVVVDFYDYLPSAYDRFMSALPRKVLWLCRCGRAATQCALACRRGAAICTRYRARRRLEPSHHFYNTHIGDIFFRRRGGTQEHGQRNPSLTVPLASLSFAIHGHRLPFTVQLSSTRILATQQRVIGLALTLRFCTGGGCRK